MYTTYIGATQPTHVCILYVVVETADTELVLLCTTQDLTVLQELETIKQLGHILKTNVRACVAVGHPFVMQVCVTLPLVPYPPHLVCVCAPFLLCFC